MKIKQVFAILIIIFTGLGVFSIKHYVKELHREVKALNAQIINEKENISTLKAEWAYLNKPERLRQLVDKYLDLQPLELSQIHNEKITHTIAKAMNSEKPVMISSRTQLAEGLLSKVSLDDRQRIEKIKWDEKKNKFIKIRKKSD